ncbi:MAG: SPOR domain-containing protein [Paracoccaceae bacterium]|nr:SPOR domain-containing protein [Paracoccaceae bacterium]
MADFTFDEGRGSYWGPEDVAENTRVTEWLNWAGALLSLVLIVGLAGWGWQLMKRDVSGVPVVRALEGPMRVAPEDPGGRLAEHQGLAVNRIAAEGTAEPPVETIVLAPAPLSLTDEDKPAADLTPVPVAPAPAAVVTPEPDAPTLTAEPANATDMAVAEALASIEAGELDIAAEEMVATPPTGGLPRSPLPRARPVVELTNVSALSSRPDAGAAIAPGTRLVQLGAFENAELAEAAWVDTEDRFGDYMVGKSKVIQEAETGGRTFFRLRAAGFADLADARRFCSVLVAGDLNCIPVVQR